MAQMRKGNVRVFEDFDVPTKPSAAAFAGCTAVDLAVSCTYDFEVVSARYFHYLEAGEVPLECLFGGTAFYEAVAGLQAAQISREKEAPFRLPVVLWRETREHYFPGSVWLRLRRETFDRLGAYKTRHGLPGRDAALEKLLGDDGGEDAWAKPLPYREEDEP